MMCMDCKWYSRYGGCDGIDCYYDHIREQREAQPGYDEKKWYMVCEIRKRAFTEVYSQRQVDAYRDENPEDDTYVFMTKEQIAEDPEIKWETDEIWYQRGQEDARNAVDKRD